MSLKPTLTSPSIVDLEAGKVDRLDLAGKGAFDSRPRLVALDRREEADGAEVDPEDRDPGAREVPQRVEDRAVAAEDDAEVGVVRQRLDRLDALRGGAVLGDLVGGRDQPPAGLGGGGDGDRRPHRSSPAGASG